MLNSVQHLTKSRLYETLKRVQGDRLGLFTRHQSWLVFTSALNLNLNLNLVWLDFTPYTLPFTLYIFMPKSISNTPTVPSAEVSSQQKHI
jgi:hypothetical protein